MQQLGIIPKDKAYVNLTESPTPLRRTKRDNEKELIKHEVTDDGHAHKTKQRPADDGSSGASATLQPNSIAANNHHDADATRVQRDKKRKALQDELREVELEQKRLRLTRELAQMDDDEK